MSIIVNRGGGGGKSGGSYHHHHSLFSGTTTTSPLSRTTGTILTILFWLPISLLTHLKSLLVSPPSAAEISPLSSSGVVSEETKIDPKELKRVFQMFDRNGDGRITQTALNDSLENLGIHIPEKDLVGMIKKIDVNGDGCVDIDEFGDLYQTIMEDKEEEEEDIKGAFDVFDRNGDGFISVEELRSVLASLGLKQGRTVEDCKVMITKVDVDGDGMVDFTEFKQMMRGGVGSPH